MSATRRRLPFVLVVAVLVVLGLLLYLRVVQVPAEEARTTHLVFNYVEAGIWVVAGIWTAWRTRTAQAPRRAVGAVAAVAFLLFGASDVVETRTGAWYEPWWLLAWKAACVVCLLTCLVLWRRISER